MKVEINLFGTGGGYGESVVIIINDKDCIIVDSCYNPNSQSIIPLDFIKSRGIKPDNIKLILCTHWHDDHIKGLSEIVSFSKNSSFSFAQVIDLHKFFRLMTIDHQKLNVKDSISSTKEFVKCINEHKRKSAKPVITYAHQDKLLYHNNYDGFDFNIYSLSPSDYSNELFNEEIGELIKNFGQKNKVMPNEKPNSRSVVIQLQAGKYSALLGADLEVSSDERLGWLNITKNSMVAKQGTKSRYFKVPHHGSENGYQEEVWGTLLDNPTSTISLYNRRKILPDQKMIDIYQNLSNGLYLTSNPKRLGSKPKKRDSRIEKILKDFDKELSEIKFQYGHVQSVIDIAESNPNWVTSLSGSAIRV